ncbi:MAG: flavin reductase family protein [Hominisplanchenecus sp.]|nr:flavin reductase family protein [Hominisplanchenecus sp.]
MAKQTWKAGNMVYPLPAVMVSCGREGERPNIITVAWTGTICTNPPMLYISVRPQRYSYDILCETGEFVVNLTTKKLAQATDYCGVRSGRDVDKFKETGLTAVPALHVKAPMIAESPVNIECRVTEKKELGSHHMFLAEVLAVHVDERYLDEKGRFRLNESGLMAYSHGEYLGLGKEIGTFGYSVKKTKGKGGRKKGSVR